MQIIAMCGTVTSKELANRMRVTPRTILRDIDALSRGCYKEKAKRRRASFGFLESVVERRNSEPRERSRLALAAHGRGTPDHSKLKITEPIRRTRLSLF